MSLSGPEPTDGAVPLLVGMSGASGSIYGLRLMQALHRLKVNAHMIVTAAAHRVAELELPGAMEQAQSLAGIVYADADIAAPPASGTFACAGMVIVPCSIKTLSAVANSYAEGLLARAADCILKERRRLVLVVRETPLHAGHLRLMSAATEMGAVILPPVPGFYAYPQSIEEIVDHTVGKILDQFDISHDLYRPWAGADGG
ncbi:MAG: 3-octaprenyl-4-hydroxybenzoate carboxy-lyase partner protein [Actinobacteria bacterium ADurb.Bin444]|nr:MAG: 3-octaprenyl-4-hydroxybenzoate carboxy-lyase partner protein [Actinobacteria bacterium ADurb.Bin444]